MVEIQPYEFKKKTNIEEHNDIVDKINEIVGVINDTQMDTIDTRLTAVEGDVTALESEVSSLDNELATKADKSEIPDVSNFITADALTPYAKTVDVDNGDITGVDATINNGEITIKLTRPDGDMSDSIDCPFIQTATLIPTSTARAFKIRFTYTDGTQYDTNEFVIPEGGGTDVSVTGVTVGNGTAPNSFKVAIQLSDASTINSNDYAIEFPENTDTYPTSLTATLSGTTLNMTIGLNDGSSVQGTANLSALLTGYATQTWVNGQLANYATDEEVTEIKTNLQEQITSIEPTVTVNAEVNPPTITIGVNGKTAKTNLPNTSEGLTYKTISTSNVTLASVLEAIGDKDNVLFSWNCSIRDTTNSKSLSTGLLVGRITKMSGGSYLYLPCVPAYVYGDDGNYLLTDITIRSTGFTVSYYTPESPSTLVADATATIVNGRIVILA